MEGMAGTTGFEPATSDVTGRRSNQLNYNPEPCARRRDVLSAAAVTGREPLTAPAGLKARPPDDDRCLRAPTSSAGLPAEARLRAKRSGVAKAGGRYRIRTCDSRRVKPVLYH